MNGRLMASPTTPLPLTRSSSCPTRSLRTVLSLPTSPGRTTPRTVMVWRSELTSRSLVASTTMVPLGSTPETRAVSVAPRIRQRRARRPDPAGSGRRGIRGAGAGVGHVVIQRSRRGLLLGGKHTACDQQDQNQRLHRLPFVTTTLPLDSTRA